MTVAPHPVDLEPSLIAAHTYVSRRRHSRLDVAAMVSITISMVYLLPAKLIVPDLTYAGRPALVLALGLFCWWVVTRLNARLVMSGPQPIRWVALAYLVAALLSYLAGLLRGLPEPEANAQNFAMLLVLQFIGVALVTADGLPNWDRLRGVLRVLVWCAGIVALIAHLQSALKIDVTTYLALPGLQLKTELIGFQNRGVGGHFRVAGTAAHYIELSAVMAMAVPFAIHFARFGQRRIHRWAAVLVALLTATAVPVSISRTGVVALAVAMLVMVPGWSWRLRYNLMLVAAGVVLAISVVRPGLLGTIKALFLFAGADPSIEARTQDYSLVAHWFAQRPWLGRGPRTLIPEHYQGIVLDNQWLYTLVTEGMIGVAALAAVHLVAIVLALIALRRSTRAEERHLCLALIAAQVVSIVVAGTFDSFYYTTLTTTVALLMGVCGAVWRLTHPARTIRTSTVPGLSA
jgi:polysaccharide biosynthesis protein PslJ